MIEKTRDRFPVTQLTCFAPHPDPRKAGEPCGTFFTYLRGNCGPVTIAERRLATPEDAYYVDDSGEELLDLWFRCTRRDCGKWCRFRDVASSDAGRPVTRQDNPI